MPPPARPSTEVRVPARPDPQRLSPGDEAPAFTLPDDTGTPVSLTELLAEVRAEHDHGRVIVYFYPAAMTPGCTTEACDFTDSLDSLHASGVSVVGVSPDPPEKLAEFRARDGLTITLLSDVDKQVLTAYGTWGDKQLYGKTVTGVIRSTFVVGADGRVERAMYNVRAKGHVAKLRRELAA